MLQTFFPTAIMVAALTGVGIVAGGRPRKREFEENSLSWDNAWRKNLDLPPPRTRVEPYEFKHPPALEKALQGREIPLHGNGKIMNAITPNGPLDIWGDNAVWPPTPEALAKERARLNQVAGRDIEEVLQRSWLYHDYRDTFAPAERKFIKHERYFLKNHLRTHPHAEFYRVMALAQIRGDTHTVDGEKIAEISMVSSHEKLAQEAFHKLNERYRQHAEKQLAVSGN